MPNTVDPDQIKSVRPSLAYGAFVWFNRLVSLACLFAGVTYWIKLIGINPGAENRFDLMPVHWQVAAASLAVLYPVAASGLWMVVSWGPVIWLAAAASEAVMYFGFPELFGRKDVTLIGHGLIALLYVAFRLQLHLEARRAAN